MGERSHGVPIGVIDPSPTFRRGLAALFREAGHHPVEPNDAVEWLSGADNRVVVMSVDTATALETVRELVSVRPDLVLVALLAHLDVDDVAAALRAGASAVIHRDEEPERLLGVVDHAIDGDALLPVDLAQVLANTPPAEAMDEIGLTTDEVRWIERLARNESVAKVAADAGLSERTMYRRLDQVFRRIGVNNRIEAIAWATRKHYIDV